MRNRITAPNAGDRFGRLVVISGADPYVSKAGRKYPSTLCRCDCGSTCAVLTSNIVNGLSKSCGCGKRGAARKFLPVGATFGTLTVVSAAPFNRRGRSECLCSCGKTTIVENTCLLNGNTSSCGCALSAWQQEFGQHTRTHGCATRQHGNTPEYICWMQMKSRCFNRRNAKYSSYGGAGITVCAQWLDFETFLKDMGPRPSSKHSIDRYPNGAGNYEPSNCRWATPTEQAVNRKCTRWFTVEGVTRCMEHHLRYYGAPGSTVRARMRSGMTFEEAVLVVRNRALER